EMLKLQCEVLVECGVYGSLEVCQSEVAYLLDMTECMADASAGVKDGRQAYDPDRAKSCLDSMKAQATCGFVPETAECETVFEGLVPTNGECFRTEECAGDNFCGGGTCPGTCLPTKGVGEVIADPVNEACREGLDEYRMNDSWVCQMPAAGGASCAPLTGGIGRQFCVDGFFCDGGSELCTAKKAKGETCTPNSSEECADGLSCVEGVCRAPTQMTYVGAGEACNYLDPILCQGGLFCEVASITAAGTCHARRPEGGACMMDESCQLGLRCEGADLSADPIVQGTCRPPRALGESCTQHSDCVRDAWCNATCLAKRPAGQTCVESAECQSGYCNGESKCEKTTCEDPTP
ncbi:MAG: hypothetical protein WBV82_31990, partial [Myxococcaceae bacterium]